MKSNLSIENKEIIIKELDTQGFFYAKHQSLEEEDFIELCEEFGTIVDYKFGGTLDINPQNPLGGNQFSNRAMCFHQDGVLTETPPDLIFLYCTESDVTQGGEHLLSRTDKILEHLREHERDIFELLQKATIKYYSKLDNYYLEDGNTKSGVTRPASIMHPKKAIPVLFMALDDPSDPEPNYRSFFNGLSQLESQKLMTALDRVARMPNHLVSLRFNVGDFLVVDNYLMIHGRNGFPLDSKRNIKRIQIQSCARQ